MREIKTANGVLVKICLSEGLVYVRVLTFLFFAHVYNSPLFNNCVHEVRPV